MDMGNAYGPEFRRCLIALDVAGMMTLWKHVAPHLANQGPREALISMHLARADMQTLPEEAKTYSLDWLAERGYEKGDDGRWSYVATPKPVYAEAVGIAVRSKYPEVKEQIVAAMSDALDNERAKGITDPAKQREAMLSARAKRRFKLRMA